MICDGEFFGHRGPWFKQSLNQLIGVLEMGPVPVNMNKTDFDRDSDAWTQVQGEMHERIAPLVRELSGARDLERISRSDWRRVRQAQRLVERVLVQLDLDELLPPEERARRRTAGPSRPPDAVEDPGRCVEGGAIDSLTLPLPLIGDSASSGGSGSVRERPPSLGARVRRQRIGWEPRLLTEDRRSDWEEVDGHRTLLINTRFPLYKESKGDVWYVVETGVFELTRRIRAGELTVDEYYDEVNRILQHAAEAAHDDDGAEPLEAVAS
jgi:hypothetical protein